MQPSEEITGRRFYGLLGVKEVAEYFKVSKGALYNNYFNAPDFPEPIKLTLALGKSKPFWRLEDIEAWIEKQR